MYGEDPATRLKRRGKLSSIRYLLAKCDVLLLQETHLVEDTTLTRIFPDHWVATSPDRERIAGVAIMVAKQFSPSPPVTWASGGRAVAVTLAAHSPDEITLANVYLHSPRAATTKKWPCYSPSPHNSPGIL